MRAAKHEGRADRSIFHVFIFEVCSSQRYRKNAEECLNRAAEARKSEDSDAWLLIAEEWLKLAEQFDAKRKVMTPQR